VGRAIFGHISDHDQQRLRAIVLSHHDQHASDDQNRTKHWRMLSSNMLLLILILLIG
jgi:hypothetical protein